VNVFVLLFTCAWLDTSEAAVFYDANNPGRPTLNYLWMEKKQSTPGEIHSAFYFHRILGWTFFWLPVELDSSHL
jgi:hypothetical protein